MRFIILLLFLTIKIYPLDVQVDAEAAVLINAKNGKVLYAKNPHKRMYPASLTKVATALFILDQKGIDYQKEIRPSNEALMVMPAGVKQANFNLYPSYRLEHDGVGIGIRHHERLPLWTIFYGMLIASGNDCANVLAESYHTSIPAFMMEMNDYLKKLGCRNTYFMNPHGLHHPKHESSAYDLALITKKAFEFDVFREVVGATAFIYPKTNLQNQREIPQTNRLLKPSSKFYYPCATGVKTGYTHFAESTLIASAQKNDRELIAVVLKCPGLTKRYENCINLFEAAFNELKEKKEILKSTRTFSRSLEGADQPLDAFLKEEVAIQYYPSEKPEQIKAHIHWHDLSLPIEKNQVVGEVRITENNEKLATFPLYAQKKIKKTFGFAVKSFFRSIFGK